MLWLLLACSNLSPDELALDPTVPLEKAVAACATLSDSRQQGRCVLEALKTRDAISAETCTNIPGRGLRGRGLAIDGKSLVGRGLGLGIQWHNECLFEAASRSTAPLSERYKMCRETGSFARQCGFQIWQKDVMKLRPTTQDANTEALVKLESLIAEHRRYAEPLDRNYEATVRTWFWGSWWESQDVDEDNRLSACQQWVQTEGQAACEKWEEKARTWISDRETNRPR